MDFKIASQSWTRGLLLLVPLVMVIARRASTLMLAAAALATLIQNRKGAVQQWRAAAFDPALLAGLAILILWGGVSLFWSPLPTRGVKQLVFDFSIPVACGLWLLSLPHKIHAQKFVHLLTMSVSIAAFLVTLQLVLNFRIEALFNPAERQDEAWRFNMVVVTYVLFVPSLLLTLKRERLGAVLALIAISLAAIFSQSATSKAALLTAAFAYIVIHFLPRKLSLPLFAFTLFGLLAIQPWQGWLVEQSLQTTMQTERLFYSAKERIIIWQASGEVALRALPWGIGMGGSDAASETLYAKALSQNLQSGLRQTHAHNAFLNVMMELGLPGLLGLALIAFGVVRTLSRLSDALYAPSMTLATQVITVDLISHGAWQAWWFTGIVLGILALKQCANQPNGTP